MIRGIRPAVTFSASLRGLASSDFFTKESKPATRASTAAGRGEAVEANFFRRLQVVRILRLWAPEPMSVSFGTEAKNSSTGLISWSRIGTNADVLDSAWMEARALLISPTCGAHISKVVPSGSTGEKLKLLSPEKSWLI